jgi:hypothetical protein
MAKKNQAKLPEQPGQPDPKADKKAAKKEAAAVVAEAAKAAKPLAVEIHFPSIVDLKQAIGFDADGNLIIALQFKAKVDQYEIFRLVNLLKQPHGSLFATIGSPQSAMDFMFTKEGKVEILKAEIAQEKAKSLAAGKTEPAKDKPAADQSAGSKALATTVDLITFQEVTFNHIPTEERPFGVVIDFVNGTGETHTVAGRGKTATEAVICGVKATKGGFEAFDQPFEIVAAVKKTKETLAQIKIIRAIEVGSFDDDNKGDAKKKKGE